MSDVRTEAKPSTQTQSRSEDHGAYIWYELMTPDPMGAKTFYDAVIGWDIQPEALPGPIEYRMIRRSDGGSAGGVLTLTDDMAQHGAKPIWLGYIYVDDVDASVASIEAGGGKTLMGASDIPEVGRIAMVADPQGAPFYVMTPKPPADKPEAKSDVFSPTAEQRVGWNELLSSDQKAALEFYTSQFGWTKGDVFPMGDMGDYQLLTHHGVQFGAAMTKAEDKPSRWRFYFRVPNVDSARDTMEARGGTVVHGPVEVPGGERVLIGTDPQGAEFALVGK